VLWDCQSMQLKKQDTILRNVCKYLTVDTLQNLTEDTNLQSDIQLYFTINIQYISQHFYEQIFKNIRFSPVIENIQGNVNV